MFIVMELKQDLERLERVLTPTDPSKFAIEDYKGRIATALVLLSQMLKEN